MSDIKYFEVELDGELGGIFQTNNYEMAVLEIAKLKISQPELKVTQISGEKYYEVLSLNKSVV